MKKNARFNPVCFFSFGTLFFILLIIGTSTQALSTVGQNLSTNGTFSVSTTGNPTVFSVDPVGLTTTLGNSYLKLSGTNTGASTEYWMGRDSNNLLFNTPVGKQIIFQINNPNAMVVSPTSVGFGNREVNGLNTLKGDTSSTSLELQGFDRSASSTTAGQNVLVTGGDGGSQTTGAEGGDLTLLSGNAGGTGDNNGGDIFMKTGNATGSGRNGYISMKNAAASRSDGITLFPSKETSTTDATQTAVASFTLENENTYHVRATVLGVQSTGGNRASYELAGTAYRTGGGSATLEGTVTTLHSKESAAAWDATLTVSGNDLSVSVTGAAGTTIYWAASLEYFNTSN